MLKKMIVLGTIALAASATPAMAQRHGDRDNRGGYEQNYRGNGGNGAYAAQIRATGGRILDAHANGRLGQGEYRALHREQRELERVFARYRQGGLSSWERNELDRKIAALNDARRYGVRDGRQARNDRRGRR